MHQSHPCRGTLLFMNADLLMERLHYCPRIQKESPLRLVFILCVLGSFLFQNHLTCITIKKIIVIEEFVEFSMLIIVS